MEESKQHKEYWYAMRILHNRVEKCVNQIDAINDNPQEMLSSWGIELPETWQKEDWQEVEVYPRPDHVSIRRHGKRISVVVPRIASLLFFRTTQKQVKILGEIFDSRARIYNRIGKKVLVRDVPEESHEAEETLEKSEVAFDKSEIISDKSEIVLEKEILQPVRIPDHEINVLKVILSKGEEGVEYLSPEKLKWGKGTKVRVIQGEFKGWEGEIRRIKCKRRLVVSIHDVHQRKVAAFCVTTYIPSSFLQEI